MVERKTDKRENDRDRNCKRHFRYCKYLFQVFQVNINQASGKSYNRFKYELSSFLVSSCLETREGRLASRCSEKYRLGCKKKCPIYLEMGTVQDRSPEDTYSLVSEVMALVLRKNEIKCNYLTNGPVREFK